MINRNPNVLASHLYCLVKEVIVVVVVVVVVHFFSVMLLFLLLVEKTILRPCPSRPIPRVIIINSFSWS